jgi:putative RNA 2'-phosphotransferase
MDRARRVRVSKLLSLGLRHEPTALALELDPAGWATVDAVLAGLSARGEPTTPEELAEVVATSDKKRFAFSEDGARLRASQGHSVDVDLGLPPREPPETLFHGTSARVQSAIRFDGLVPGSRTHVHLSADVRTAEIVAKRREGPHVILRVRARAMHAAGLAFFVSENGVWLTERVPPDFIEPS